MWQIYFGKQNLLKVLVSEDELQDISEHKGHIVSEQSRGCTGYDA